MSQHWDMVNVDLPQFPPEEADMSIFDTIDPSPPHDTDMTEDDHRISRLGGERGRLVNHSAPPINRRGFPSQAAPNRPQSTLSQSATMQPSQAQFQRGLRSGSSSQGPHMLQHQHSAQFQRISQLQQSSQLPQNAQHSSHQQAYLLPPHLSSDDHLPGSAHTTEMFRVLRDSLLHTQKELSDHKELSGHFLQQANGVDTTERLDRLEGVAAQLGKDLKKISNIVDNISTWIVRFQDDNASNGQM
ncbi:hypothetical protein LTR70_004874 [Exophiala xenobiotica]|uniref:Uncharacterized protein n=1 Tax=Lithohypha guttulata TaxID=1690604 RepID=A0ABR0KBW9_9EURO|nr:hypothetical protein LTR24_004492 [Lithohypha guttulata]KAK5319829.1 hypothetical protein LTR70_004874 [Exophiala xenobiotica]